MHVDVFHDHRSPGASSSHKRVIALDTWVSVSIWQYRVTTTLRFPTSLRTLRRQYALQVSARTTIRRT
jgi:hypothetical protein